MIKVLVFGTFDGLHPGHLDFFRQAKALGGRLVAVVGRDATVQNIKGRLPKKDEDERRADIKSAGVADEVLLGNLNDPYRIIKDINPDIIALGYDQNSFSRGLPAALKKIGLKAKIMRLNPFEPDKYHSSLL